MPAITPELVAYLIHGPALTTLPLFGEAASRRWNSDARRFARQERDRQRVEMRQRYQDRALARVLEGLASGLLHVAPRAEDAEQLAEWAERFDLEGAVLELGGPT